MNTRNLSLLLTKLGNRHLVPLIIMLIAAVALALSLIGILDSGKWQTNIIIALLLLLAFDALQERITVLERLERGHDELSANIANLAERVQPPARKVLKPRSAIKTPEELGAEAKEICLLGIHAVTALNYEAFFKKKIEAGCNIRILLLNPNKRTTIQVWNKITGDELQKTKIETSLKEIEQWIGHAAKHDCKLKVLDVFLPFSMFAVDPNLDSGTMNVEHHVYKGPIDGRPHIHLKREIDLQLFNYYIDQFNKAWEDAEDWA